MSGKPILGKDAPLVLTSDDPVEFVPARSLHGKLAQVMYEVERIPKRGRAPAAMGGFEFVQVGDAADVIRKALAEHKVSMIPTAIELIGETEHATAKGGTMTTMTVRTTWTLTDGDSGETAVIQSLGSGADTGDKAAPKAQSNAMKYALLMGFLLSTGDDPELHDTSDRQRPTAAAAKPAMAAPPAPGVLDGGVVGTADIGKGDADFELRMTPDGHAIGFRLVSGATQLKVIAFSPLAEMLADRKKDVIGARSTAWGSIEMESWDKVENGKTKTITYPVLTLTRIKGPTFDLAMPEAPEFSKAEQAAVDAALDAAPVTA